VTHKVPDINKVEWQHVRGLVGLLAMTLSLFSLMVKVFEKSEKLWAKLYTVASAFDS